ncbi:nitroreductase family protein [Plantactinospora sp. BB1]|uniref:nitroreductase family protein n=1 Tax=Plantactinospora sp. BB1 TaxID=2071627 RepID=UPI000D175680|nr:nitroreductase family protein [Plantactinospora sp. BB1]AVT38146.1 nitroreductase [Plantactinospora sp. BB1]
MSPTGYTREDLELAVVAAARAPVPEQSQPWLRLHGGAIDVLVSPPRASPAGAHAGWAARIGGGAGLFNVRLALRQLGRPALVRLRPYRDEPDLLARLHPGPAQPPGPTERELFAALPLCRVDAGPVVPTPVPPEVRRRLIDAARTEHGWLELIVGHAAVAAFTEIEASAGRVLDRARTDPVRWRTAAPPFDGPFHLPCDVPAGRGDRSGTADEPAQRSDQGPGQEPDQEPVVAVLGSPADGPGAQLRAGQALQRVLLTAAAAGLTTCLHSQVMAVPAAREQLRLALGRFGRPQMVLRIGHRPAHRGTPPAVADPNRTSREDGSKVPAASGPSALPRPVVHGVE